MKCDPITVRCYKHDVLCCQVCMVAEVRDDLHAQEQVMIVVDLVGMAAAALADVDRTRPPDAHVVHRNRIKLAIHVLANQGPDVYFNEIIEVVEKVAGPCPCTQCRNAEIGEG